MLIIIFLTQIIVGLTIYGRGWWHAAFAAPTEEVPNTKQLFIEVRGYNLNLTAFANGLLGLLLIATGIYGLAVVL